MKPQFLFIICITLAISCSRTRPAGFWANFYKDQLAETVNDHGPWGGYSTRLWKSDSALFTATAIINFVQKNNWTTIDSLPLSTDPINTASLPALKADPYTIGLLKNAVIPLLQRGHYKIILFETGWLAVEPGNARETFGNGFAVLGTNGTSLKVFHYWGE